MKKLLAICAMMALTINIASAGTLGQAVKSDFKAAKNAVKTDVKNTKNAVKSDVKTAKTNAKTDINNKKAQTKADIQKKVDEKTNNRVSTAQAKKAEKIADIDKKLNQYNSELKAVKANKDITETERAVRVKNIQTKIDLLNKQKAALK